MKIINIVLVIVSILAIIGLFYNGTKNDKDPVITGSSNTIVLSIDSSVIKIEEDTVYVLEGTVQSDILNNVASEDDSPQTYRITTSEGSSKSLDEVYEYDRLYVTAENEVHEDYYRILFTDSLE